MTGKPGLQRKVFPDVHVLEILTKLQNCIINFDDHDVAPVTRERISVV